MSKTNKNKAVDPDYAKLKRENARLKAPHNTIAERLNGIIKLVFLWGLLPHHLKIGVS